MVCDALTTSCDNMFSNFVRIYILCTIMLCLVRFFDSHITLAFVLNSTMRMHSEYPGFNVEGASESSLHYTKDDLLPVWLCLNQQRQRVSV